MGRRHALTALSMAGLLATEIAKAQTAAPTAPPPPSTAPTAASAATEVPVQPTPPPPAPSAPLDQPPAAAPATKPTAEEEPSMTFRATDMESFSQATSRETVGAGVHARWSLNVFGDVGGGIVGGNHGYDTKPSFGINNFSMLFSGNLENSLRFVSEMSVEPNEGNEIGIDLERLSLRWTAPFGAWVEAGRTHIDLGYWNNAYHHGTWLQPSILRPRAVRFEDSGGILPVHWIGAAVGWLGKLAGDTALRASVAVGNGRGYQEDDLQLKFDTHAPKQAYAQVELKGVGLRDLSVGVSGVYGYISPDARRADPRGLFETIGGAHIAFPSTPFMLLSEGYVVSHEGGGASWQMYDAFLLVGYSIRWLTPYVMGELNRTKGGADPFYVIDPKNPLVIDGVPTPDIPNMTAFGLYEGTVGLRFDVSTWCAVKTEYRLTRFDDQHLTTHLGYVAWQFGL
jgi:hypothetical protein